MLKKLQTLFKRGDDDEEDVPPRRNIKVRPPEGGSVRAPTVHEPVVEDAYVEAPAEVTAPAAGAGSAAPEEVSEYEGYREPVAAPPPLDRRFTLAVSSFRQAPRADVVVNIQAYGRGAVDVNHILVASRSGEVAGYEDGKWDNDTPVFQSQLAFEDPEDAIACGFQGGYGVGVTLITEKGYIYGIRNNDSDENDVDAEELTIPKPLGKIYGLPAGAKVIAGAATSGQQPFPIALDNGSLVMVEEKSVRATINLGRPIAARRPDTLTIDYYGGYITVLHEDMKTVSVVSANGSRCDLKHMGFVLHGGDFCYPQAMPESDKAVIKPYRRDTVLLPSDQLEIAAAGRPTVVSVSGNGTDGFISYEDGSCTYVKCFESGYPTKCHEFKVMALQPAPAQCIPTIVGTAPHFASTCPLSLLGTFIAGAPHGKLAIFYAPEWEKGARGDYREAERGPDDKGRCFAFVEGLPAEGGRIVRVNKLKGDASPNPWIFTFSNEEGKLGIVVIGDGKAGKKWAEILANRPTRYDASS